MRVYLLHLLALHLPLLLRLLCSTLVLGLALPLGCIELPSSLVFGSLQGVAQPGVTRVARSKSHVHSLCD